MPRALWERTDPPDGKNRVTLGLNVALIETAGRKILVDTGMGDKWSEKERSLYRIDGVGSLLGSLRERGLGPADIDIVINTHLHFDHAGGDTRIVDGRPLPTFPRARYLVQKGEWDDATSPHERSRASYREADIAPLAEAGQVDALAGDAEVAPGVRVVRVGGHTAHHQMVVAEGGGRTLFIPTDLLPTTSHLPLPFIMGYDLFPVTTLEAKRGLLREAAERGSWILFYHDRETPLGRVRREGDRYRLSEGGA